MTDPQHDENSEEYWRRLWWDVAWNTDRLGREGGIIDDVETPTTSPGEP